MRIIEFYHRHKILLLDLILLLIMCTGLWNGKSSMIGFLCGMGTGIMLYRIGERLSKEQAERRHNLM
jgi:hypothetical protein